MALEQANVVLGSMQLLREQLDYAHWYEVADLVSLCNLATDLLNVDGLVPTPALQQQQKAGVELARNWAATLQELSSASAALRDAISEVVESVFSFEPVEVLKAVQRLTLDHCKDQLGRERAFVAGTKWDGYPESLQTIRESLRQVKPLRPDPESTRVAQEGWNQSTL
jgi:hypothetical protein